MITYFSIKIKMYIRTVKEYDQCDSIFIYQPDFLTINEQEVFFNYLNEMDDFKINMNYKESKIIRQQKWYQTENRYFCSEWKHRYDRWESHNYDEYIFNLQQKIQKYVNKCLIKTVKLNSCLINKYRDGKDNIRPHRDTEKSFGTTPTIIGLSIGAERDIQFERIIGSNGINFKKDNNNKHLNFKQRLKSGSLFIMAGNSQINFTHEIPKCDSKEVRYSLTFRELID